MSADIIEEFDGKFNEIKNKKIALYGIGENTRLILENVEGYHFLALLDPSTIGQTVYGKKVISYEELSANGIDVVIIVARRCFVNLIYNRIALYCMEHGIEVYDVYGSLLMKHRKVTVNDIPDNLDLDAYGMCRYSPAADVLDFQGDAAGKTMIDLSVKRLFGKPGVIYETKGKVPIMSEYDLGYAILGPIITQFMLWLFQEVRQKNIDCVVFGARDGYVFHKLYQMQSEKDDLPICKYIYTSRMCCVAAGIENERDIEYAMQLPFSGSAAEMLVKRFFLQEEDIEPQNSRSNHDYIMAHKDKIIAISKKKANNYTRYLLQELGQYSNIAYVDFFASGTCQLYIEKLIKKKMKGLYFYHAMVNSRKKKALEIDSFYPIEKEETFLEKIYNSLESMIASHEPTLREMSENLTPVFIKEARTPEEIESVKKIQEGIIAFSEEYQKIGLGMSNSIKELDYLLSFYNSEISEIRTGVLDRTVLIDEFVNREFEVL